MMSISEDQGIRGKDIGASEYQGKRRRKDE
jgi:hypothetical protein